MKTPVVMSWSGSKDSALALHELRLSDQHEVVALMTSISEGYRRISHHGVREERLEEQAAAIGIPLEKIYLPAGNSQPCTNEVYEQIMSDIMAKFYAQGVRTVAFGDLFLEDLRAWREANLAKSGILGVLPVWNRDPCGEYGEFHSFVYDGPIFRHPVAVQVGDIVTRDGRYYADLLPAGMIGSGAVLADSIPPV